MTYTRRRLLRAGVAGVVVASAGCAGVLEDDSSDGSDGGDGSAGGDGTGGDDGGDPPAAAPTVTFDFEEHDDQLIITHDGGESLDPENVDIRGPVGDWIPTSDSVTAGDRITLVFESSAQEGDVVEIVWLDPESDNEAVLDEHALSG